MHRVREQDLPFQGSSYQFVGADQGNVEISVFLLRRFPDGARTSSPPIRRGPIHSGGPRPLDGQRSGVRGGAGDILVIKAGEIHGFTCIGDTPPGAGRRAPEPAFIQENLG